MQCKNNCIRNSQIDLASPRAITQPSLVQLFLITLKISMITVQHKTLADLACN